MRRLWHAFVELLRRWGILARDESYTLAGELVERVEKGRTYSRRRCLFPSAARQLRDLRSKAGLSLREVAILWGRAKLGDVRLAT